VNSCVGAAVGGAGVGVVPGTGVGVGARVGGSGAVGQLASAGLKGVGEGVGDGVGVGVGEVRTAVADGVGVTSYGVYEGQGSSVAAGGAWAPAITSEIATAIAPTSTVTTKVIAPHSRRNALMRQPWPGRR
jgi:hypothetical protein